MKTQLYAWDGESEREVDYIPATLSEIKEAHPKCGTCAFVDGFLCMNEDSLHTYKQTIHPTTDYCNHYEEKEAL